jgi:hypothetical protein
VKIGIDPGLRHCGIAYGESSLVRAELVLNPERTARGPLAWVEMCCAVMRTVPSHVLTGELHIEVPRYYPRQRYIKEDQNVDPNDLIELAGVVGSLATQWHSVKFYYPSDWKGQVPKKIMTERIRKKLRPSETENIVSVGAKDHNTLDAVGIFLHSIGRL